MSVELSGWRKRQIALDKKAENARELGLDYDIHSCSPFCTRPMCVAEAVQVEREDCAKLAAATVCDTHIPTGVKIYGTVVAKAIRARGQA